MSRDHSGEERSALRWALGAVAVASCLALAAMFAMVVAVLGASFGCQGQGGEAAAVSGPAPSSAALQDIPPERLRLYQRAGARFDIDWSFLASIGAQECNHDGCAGPNSSGCAGPMQISYVRGSPCSPGSGPTLWERYAVSAHSGQAPSVNDPADAILTAARILRQAMSAPPIGGPYAAYRQAACSYYGACQDAAVSYADEVMARAVQYGFSGAGTPVPTSPSLAQPGSAQPESGCAAGVVAPGAGAGSNVVAVAEGQVGQSEQPRGSNCTIYGPCEEWCSLFVAWVWQHSGVPLPGPTALYGYSGALYAWVREHGGRVLPASATPAPGDAVFFGAGPNASVHVGIVVRVMADGEIATVDGNYANQVSRVGPFKPSTPAGESAAVYGYAAPPGGLP
jgi:CHAP domain